MVRIKVKPSETRSTGPDAGNLSIVRGSERKSNLDLRDYTQTCFGLVVAPEPCRLRFKLNKKREGSVDTAI